MSWRRMSWRTSGSRRVVPILAASVSVALAGACNLIAGIDEGTLVDASLDGGSRHEAGPSHDATTEGTGHRDGGPEASPPDARGGDTGRTLDAGVDAAPRPLKCTAIGTPTLVEDLTTQASPDSGVLSYGGAGLFVEPIAGGGFFIVNQIASDQSEFFVYEAENLGSSSINRVAQSGSAAFGTSIRLLDVETTGSGTQNATVNALISYSFPIHGGPPQNGLQVVPLPVIYPGGSSGNPYNVFEFSSQNINNTQLTDVPPNDAGRTLAYATNAEALGSLFAIEVGTTGPTLQEAGAGPTEIYEQNGQVQGGNTGFFAAGNSTYYLTGGLTVDAGVDGGLLEYVVNDNGDGGLVGWISPPASPKWGLIGAKRSSQDASKVILLAAAASVSGAASVDVYAATVDPSTLPGLTVGKPPFQQVSTVPSTSVPVYGGSSSSWYGDDYLRVGATADQTGILALWLAPTGEVIAFTAAPVVTTDSTVLDVAGIFDSSNFISETLGATLDIAWIEQAAADAGALGSQRMFAQRISCVPGAGGD